MDRKSKKNNPVNTFKHREGKWELTEKRPFFSTKVKKNNHFFFFLVRFWASLNNNPLLRDLGLPSLK